jgi:hypothetical protein
LISKAEELVKGRGFKQAGLAVKVSNTRAGELYENLDTTTGDMEQTLICGGLCQTVKVKLVQIQTLVTIWSKIYEQKNNLTDVREPAEFEIRSCKGCGEHTTD